MLWIKFSAEKWRALWYDGANEEGAVGMRWRWAAGLLCLVVLLSGCGQQETAAYQTISPEAAYEALEAEDAEIILVDVRSQAEYESKHIPGSILLPLDELEQQADRVLTDKDAVIYVYCQSGRRSKKAAQWLAEAGYTQVYDLGGIASWPYATE